MSLAIDVLVRAWNWAARQGPVDPAWAPDDEAPTQVGPRSDPVRIIAPCDDAVGHAAHDWQHPLGWAARCPGLPKVAARLELPPEVAAAEPPAPPTHIPIPIPIQPTEPERPPPRTASTALQATVNTDQPGVTALAALRQKQPYAPWHAALDRELAALADLTVEHRDPLVAAQKWNRP